MNRRAVVVGLTVLIVVLVGRWTTIQWERARRPASALEVSGRIEGDEVAISSKVTGRLQRLLFKEGDSVRQGDLLAVLSADELDARLRQAGGQAAAARAQVAKAETEVTVLALQLGQADTGVALSTAQVGAQRQQAEADLRAALAKEAQARHAFMIARARTPRAVDEAKAAVRTADADLVRAQSAREQARRDLVRFRSLETAGAVARADLEDAGTKLETTSAQVDAAAQQAQRARAALHQVEAEAMDVEVREEEARAAAEQVEAARGRVALAKAGLLEVKRQGQQRQTVEQQLEIARAGLAADRAQLQAAVAARDELQAMQSETKVYAPLSGVVLHKIINAGEVVAPGAPLVSLVDLRALWLKVFVPEPQIGKIRLGLPAKVYVDAFPGRPIAARVSEISERAEFTPKDVETREERVKLVFAVKLGVDNPDGMLKPGMPADASILWKTEPAP